MSIRLKSRALFAISLAAFGVAIISTVWMFSTERQQGRFRQFGSAYEHITPDDSVRGMDKNERIEPATGARSTAAPSEEAKLGARPASAAVRPHQTPDVVRAEASRDHAIPLQSLKSSPEARHEALLHDPKSSPEPRHGLLTAGTIDDVLHWNRYLTFLTDSMQRDPHELLPRTPFGQRVVIQVRDEQQHPIHGAQVTINSPTDTLVSCPTGSDGVVHFVAPFQDAQRGLQVTVEKNDERVTQSLKHDQQSHVVEMKRCRGESPIVLDLALVIDTTGSMGDELAYLQAEIAHITTQAQAMFPNVRQRLALIVYRDNGDQYVMRSFDFTEDLRDFRAKLNEQAAAGGGDYPEAMHVALSRARRLNWEEGSARLVFLVGDAPPHDKHLRETLDYGKDFRSEAISIYPIGASGIKHKAEFLLRSLAVTTGGQYLFLTDHSGIGNAHAAPHVDQFDVERLDRAMLRMVASELTGKRLAADEVIAIESGDLAYHVLTRDDYASVSNSSRPEFDQRPAPVVTHVAQAQAQSPPAILPIVGAYASTHYRQPLWRRIWSTLEEHAIWVVVGNFVFGAIFLGLSVRQHLQTQQPPQQGDQLPNFLIK